MCVQETGCSTIVGVDTHKYVHVAVAITGRTSELSRSRRSAKQRRTSVLESLEAKREGGSTTYAAKLAAEPLGGTATVCTITHYCRTTVFKYPGCHMSTEDPVPQSGELMVTRSRSTFSGRPTTFSRLSTARSTPPSIGSNARAGSKSNWEKADNRNRDFKYYRLTPKGTKQLLVEESKWKQMSQAIASVMWPAEES